MALGKLLQHLDNVFRKRDAEAKTIIHFSASRAAP